MSNEARTPNARARRAKSTYRVEIPAKKGGVKSAGTYTDLDSALRRLGELTKAGYEASISCWESNSSSSPAAYSTFAWYTPCRTLSEKLVLVYAARLADATGSSRVRLDPAISATEIGVGVSRIDAALAGLHRSKTVFAHRWTDTGAWTIEFPPEAFYV